MDEFKDRFLSKFAFSSDFGRQMRFIIGPRQCGKTTIAMRVLPKEYDNYYYNWDEKKTRDKYKIDPNFLAEHAAGRVKSWVCMDEIHKMPKWKNILKGMFDRYEKRLNFVVTGSAKLDTFRKSGDSLAGRYFVFSLNPMIAAELAGKKAETVLPEKTAAETVEKMLSGSKPSLDAVNSIMKHTGFPEPLLKGEDVFSRKWHDYYFERIIKQDMRDLTRIRDLEKVSELIFLLPGRIGSPLSVNSLKEDLELNFSTVSGYIKELTANYALFSLAPYTGNMNRLVKKERKFYFYNFASVKNEGIRFENFAAVELKARLDLWNDSGADKYDLHFIRQRDGKETDFLVTKNLKPFFLVECKLSLSPVEPHHRRVSEALGNVPFVQLIKKPGVLRNEGKDFFCASAERFLG